jgi:type II secretory pathway pseudopilin PulG
VLLLRPRFIPHPSSFAAGRNSDSPTSGKPIRPASARERILRQRDRAAFTLIELLVVITIIIVLMGLLFPAFRGAQDQAKRVQAKNDLTQIVTAVNAYFTEYGQYPCGTQGGGDGADYVAADDSTQSDLMDNLRARFGTLNARQIAFLNPPPAKDSANPKAGIGGNGRYYDPWGSAYRIKIDNNYNNVLQNPYDGDSGAGPAYLNMGVLGWSLGKDTQGGTGSKTTGTGEDDVVSWQ